MKKSILFFALISAFACQKVETVDYKVGAIVRSGAGCKYLLTAPNKPSFEISDECGKYKINQVVFKVVE